MVIRRETVPYVRFCLLVRRIRPSPSILLASRTLLPTRKHHL